MANTGHTGSANTPTYFGIPNELSIYQNIVSDSKIAAINPIYTGMASSVGIAPVLIEWSEFAMWIRGFLFALEGKELTPEDSAKIMNKLATVDPESQQRNSYIAPNPFLIPTVQPALQPVVQPGPTWVQPTTGQPTWTYTQSHTLTEPVSATNTPEDLTPVVKGRRRFSWLTNK